MLFKYIIPVFTHGVTFSEVFHRELSFLMNLQQVELYIAGMYIPGKIPHMVVSTNIYILSIF